MRELKIRENIIENNNFKHMVGGGVISEGGYGCVFHPKLTCSGKTTSNTNYISKIQRENFFSNNEIYISSLIKDIQNYEQFFSIVLSSCKVSLSKISHKDISNCEITLKGAKTAVLFNLKYINNKDVYAILTSKKLLQRHFTNDDSYSSKHTIFIIINTFKMILVSLGKLKQHQIIHYDLKPDNILYDVDRNIPIIIDFGISIHKDKLDPSTYKKHFYTFYPEYYVWCLDIHYICYLINVNQTPKEDEIKEICDMFIEHNPVFKMFSDDFVAKYKKTSVNSLVRWIGKDYLVVIEKLLMYSDAWDQYSISIIYLTIIHYWGVRGFDDNKFIIDFSKLLVQNIHPFSERCHSINDTIKIFEGFFYTNASEENIDSVINIVDDNFDVIRTGVVVDKKRLTRLKKNITL
jgi:serine/threonine protein kinase